ncbi:TldD/PmbA family protein [Geitlerinema sp. PCC 9228]|jgi:PmbA protein|uniref:TldD/PmbA family protein n=1 Tax=Geitlerinema sp. PCC 9228 TaxID=111611 RepID=UPI0008F9CFA6|nr:TldD/PmbA family protein [Geitlerinema sp. PCC 9228]
MGSAKGNAENLADTLIALAKRSGAQAAEVFQSRSQARPVFFEANRLKHLESNESEGTALRLWRDGCPGLAVAHGEVDPQALVDRAIAISKLNPPEEIELHEGIEGRYPDVGQSVGLEQLVEWGQEAIAQVRPAYPEVLCQAEFTCETETTTLTNSQGLYCSQTDTTLSSYFAAEWVRGDDFLTVEDGQTQRDSLDPKALTRNVLQRLSWAQTNVQPILGRVPILFTSKAADMLWETIQEALNGKRALEKATPWYDRLGYAVLSPAITLYQDPKAGPFSCPFDDEGTPTSKLTFVEDGVLKLFYCDRATSRAWGWEHPPGGSDGLHPTGNGFRPSLGSYPTPGLYNFLVKPGERGLSQMMADLNEGIIVDQMLGGEIGLSGDFSINVELGYCIRGGEAIGRIKDTMVAGNIYKALNQLVYLGNDAEWNGAIYTPSLVVDGLTVTGRCS